MINLNKFIIFFPFLFALLLTSIFATDNMVSMQSPNGIVAIVEDKIITKEDVQRQLAPYARQLQREATSMHEFEQKLTAIAREVLESMIDDILLVQDFKSDKRMKIPESFLENHYCKFIEETFQGNRSNYLTYLESRGLTDRSFREEQKDDIILNFRKANIRKSLPEITPEQIKKFYEENKAQFMQTEAVHLRQIILHPISDDDADSTLLLEKANDAIALLLEGKPFNDVAKLYSQDEKKDSGGDWGWINRSDIRKELADLAFSLEKKSFSNPVILNRYAFILYVEDKQKAGLIPIEDTREQIKKVLENEYVKKVQAREVAKLRKHAHIKYVI